MIDSLSPEKAGVGGSTPSLATIIFDGLGNQPEISHLSEYPDSNIRRHIVVPRIRIWLAPIDRRSPVNRDATQNEAKKDQYIQPVTQAERSNRRSNQQLTILVQAFVIVASR